MRKIKEILRLKWNCGFGNRQIARSCGIARSTVGEYLRRAQKAGLSWPLPEEMTETRVEQLLFPPPSVFATADRPLPIWADVHHELRRKKNLTLALLLEEYKEQSPQGFQYSWYCDLYRAWAGKLHLWMRQEHKAGEKLFVDYYGQTVPITAPADGTVHETSVFVAVFGASSYAYAEITRTQKLPDWINSHVRAFAYIGGVTELVAHDNLKNGVTTPCWYEPKDNQTYLNMLAHYGTASLPGRVRHPRDQAKVEAGVQIVQRWILARLRNRKFFSLAELNAEIRRLLENLNQRSFKKLQGSRRSQFETLDRPALKSLPLEPYVYSEWMKATVQLNYHIEVERHFYSIPYQLYKQVLEVPENSTSGWSREGYRLRLTLGIKTLTRPRKRGNSSAEALHHAPCGGKAMIKLSLTQTGRSISRMQLLRVRLAAKTRSSNIQRQLQTSCKGGKPPGSAGPTGGFHLKRWMPWNPLAMHRHIQVPLATQHKTARVSGSASR